MFLSPTQSLNLLHASSALPRCKKCELDFNRLLIAKIEAASPLLEFCHIYPEESNILARRKLFNAVLTKALHCKIEKNNDEILTFHHKKSTDNVKACQTTEDEDYSSGGKHCKEDVDVNSWLNENLPSISTREGSTVVVYNVLNRLQVIVCLGDITTLDTDTMVNIAGEDLDHCDRVSAFSETFRSKSLTMPFHSAGVFGVPLNICCEAIIRAVKEFSSQGGRSVCRIILIDNRRHVVRAMLEVCDRLLHGTSDKNSALRRGEVQMDVADRQPERRNEAEGGGSGVHVEIVLGTIETQEVGNISVLCLSVFRRII